MMAKSKDILRITYKPDDENKALSWLGIIGIIFSYFLVEWNTVNSIHSYVLGLFFGVLFVILIVIEEKRNEKLR